MISPGREPWDRTRSNKDPSSPGGATEPRPWRLSPLRGLNSCGCRSNSQGSRPGLFTVTPPGLQNGWPVRLAFIRYSRSNKFGGATRLLE